MQRCVQRMAGAEHPLIAAGTADAAADLIGERLKTEAAVGNSQRAGQRRVGALPLLFGEKLADRLLETPLQQVDVAVERDAPLRRRPLALWNLEAVNRVEEEQRADTLVEVLRSAPELLELRALPHQIRQRQIRAQSFQRPVADLRVRSRDDLDQAAHERPPAPPGWSASISTSEARISLRSAPVSASASCACSSP